MKVCKDCKKEKDNLDFYGVQGECKECTKKRVCKNYLLNRTHYLLYEKIRRGTLGRKIKMKEYQKSYDLRYPKKDKAVNMVNNAVRDKRLKKNPCEVCGEMKVEGHHSDYSKPLEVMWLCQKHHKEWHKKNKAKNG